MVEGLNKFWSTPFRITKWKEFSLYGEELITVIKQLEEVRTKEVESIEIAGLDQGLTTRLEDICKI